MLLLVLACAPKIDAPVADTGDPVDTSGDTDTTDTTDTDSGDTDSGDTAPADTDTDTDSGASGVDADGDGSVAATDGGDDCDDTDAAVHPGAAELCDEIDQDCDGEALAEAGCGEAQDLTALSSGYIDPPADGKDGTYTSPRVFVGDADADGRADVLLSRSWREDLGYATIQHHDVHFVTGRPIAPIVIDLADPWFDDAGWLLGSDHALGDWDGDGAADLAFVNGLSIGSDGTCEGAALVVPGAPSAWGSGQDIWAAPPIRFDADLRCAEWAEPGDFDGDGIADAAIMTLDVVSGTRRLSFLGGRAGAGAVAELGDEPALVIAASLDDALSPGDLDGDGLDDLVVPNTDGFAVVSGAVFVLAAGEALADVATATYTGEETVPRPRIGDLDGDGLADLLVRGDRPDHEGVVYVLDGLVAGADRDVATDAMGSWVGAPDDRIGVEAALDFDGDGAKELLFLVGDDFVLAPIAGAPAAGEAVPAGLRLTLDGTTQIGTATRAGDFDGDGDEDLLWSNSDVATKNRTYILAGWPVPWDDPRWW